MSWPIKPAEWVSQYNSNNDFDYLFSKKHEGIAVDHHCKLSWELSKPYIKNYRVAIDIGCRDGEYTHYLFPNFNHVYSFDYRRSASFPKNVPNGNVTWFITGLSDKVETVLASGGGQLENLSGPKHKFQTTLHTLDSFAFTDVDYIKIDTDGFELRIILGALETLKNNDPVLVIEQGHFDNKEALNYCVSQLGYKHVATCSRGMDHILVRE